MLCSLCQKHFCSRFSLRRPLSNVHNDVSEVPRMRVPQQLQLQTFICKVGSLCDVGRVREMREISCPPKPMRINILTWAESVPSEKPYLSLFRKGYLLLLFVGDGTELLFVKLYDKNHQVKMSWSQIRIHKCIRHRGWSCVNSIGCTYLKRTNSIDAIFYICRKFKRVVVPQQTSYPNPAISCHRRKINIHCVRKDEMAY